MIDLRTGGPGIEAAIASAAARSFNGAFDPDIPFALLGIDSLGTVEMAAALEEQLGHDLPPELLLECRNGRALAARIRQLRATGRLESREDPFEQMLADAVLPEDVRPLRRLHEKTDLPQARRVLLTGATGFVGSALVKELLGSTDAEIVCLVRTPAAVNAQPRGRASERGSDSDVGPTFRSGGVSRSGGMIRSGGVSRSGVTERTRPVIGDLSHPRLGLSEAAFGELAAGIDAVLHCGASVNWVYPYSALRAPNVLGTLELLRLACRHGVPFHFISSLSVCYSTEGPRSANEAFDALPHIRGVQLGYAQTKIVAESLVREAARRGLPARIYRPALISGDSRTGDYNRDDLISALIRGCVQMGTAPELDWKLDCLPVDFVSRAIVALSGDEGPVFHIGHERPRGWRECVLWMRMYGYPIRLVPYHSWLRQLERDTRGTDPGLAVHPLRPLRTFFLDCPTGLRGLTLPELYEEGRRTRADSEATLARLSTAGLSSPPLTAPLLETYFRAFRDRGDLAAPNAPDLKVGPTSETHPPDLKVGPTSEHPPDLKVGPTSEWYSPDLEVGPTSPPFRPAVVGPTFRSGLHGEPQFTSEFFSSLLNRRVDHVRVMGSGSEHSIVSELTAWRSRQPTGLFRVVVQFADGSEQALRLKIKAHGDDVAAVGEALAGLVDPAIGEAYARWSDRIGFAASHIREIEIYRQRDARFVQHAPRLFGSVIDSPGGRWMMALEEVEDARLMNTEDDPGAWTPNDIARAIEGLAALHAIWFSREPELRAAPWIGFVQSARGMAEMSDLWQALAHHASPSFSSWSHPEIGAIHRQLVAAILEWWPWMETGSRTLIHHDFNPRNVCLRGETLTALDWELATVGSPQRDLAEFLCFVLPSDVDIEGAQRWVEFHRVSLERETGTVIDPDAWGRGFRAGLYDLLVNRLSIYAVVHRVRRQDFLPRVVRTWHRMYGLFPLQEHA